MVRRFGNAATTAGLKVTTTIDSRLQAAANRAMRENLMAYDERHGYRGPLARVELPAGAADAATPLEPARDRRGGAARAARRLSAVARLRERDRARARTTSARDVFFAAHGEQAIGLDAVEWAAPFINDDVDGAKPTTVAEVLQPGDVVRFRRTAEGGWRLAQIPEAQGAFVSVDPFDGAIVALNGGLDFFLNNFNRATQARAAAGSSFKPFVYSAAFENGFTPATVVLDAPLDVGYQASLERVWRPENFGGKYFGSVAVARGADESMNSVSIRMLQSMGVPAASSHVKRFGFDDVAVPNDLSLALGAGGVAPAERRRRLRGVRERRLQGHAVLHRSRRHRRRRGAVRDASRSICPECNTPPETPVQLEPAKPELVADATELYPKQRAAPRVISPQNAYLIGDMLLGRRARAARATARGASSAATTSPARRARRTKAATPGSSDSTPTSSARRGSGSMQYRPLGGNEQGSSAALPMWIGFMREALAGTPERRPKRPPGIVEYRINPDDGAHRRATARRTPFSRSSISITCRSARRAASARAARRPRSRCGSAAVRQPVPLNDAV